MFENCFILLLFFNFQLFRDIMTDLLPFNLLIIGRIFIRKLG